MESGSARRLLPPGSVSIGSFQLGQRQHTHTVSICKSIAPHGRARPRAVTQMARGDLQMTHPRNSVSPLGLLKFTWYNKQIYPSDGGWRLNKGGWAVRSTGMRLHNSRNLIKMCTERLHCWWFVFCFALTVVACAVTLSTRSVPDFWSQEEPSGAYTQGTEWPRYGGCVMASARTHARSWRGKTGQPEWDLGPLSQAIKGPHEYYCALLSKSPQLFTKGWPTHTKNIAAKWWWRLQQLPLLCAKQ